MHIANIHESEQWANEISILFGVIGIILLGKILNMVHIIWIWTFVVRTVTSKTCHSRTSLSSPRGVPVYIRGRLFGTLMSVIYSEL